MKKDLKTKISTLTYQQTNEVQIKSNLYLEK